MFLDLLARDDQNVVLDTDDSLEPIRMGSGPCTRCDCPGFVASPGPGRTCIGHNSSGGTCNHWDSEHA